MQGLNVDAKIVGGVLFDRGCSEAVCTLDFLDLKLLGNPNINKYTSLPNGGKTGKPILKRPGKVCVFHRTSW